MENEIKNIQTLDLMINADIPVIEKYTEFTIYKNVVDHLVNMKTIFKKDWIEINKLADRIIWENENAEKP